jgi:hypothetical protein
MNKVKRAIEDLRLMQQYPKFYLANYFSDLKREIDLEFIPLNENYSEIINMIEKAEINSYNNARKFITFDSQIDFIEKQLDNNNSNPHLNYLLRLIDELKYKIEKYLHSNKTIMFLKNWVIQWNGIDKKWDEKTFLLIINDEYLRKNTLLDNNFECFNREKLIAYLIRNLLDKIETFKKVKKILNLDIQIINKTKIEVSNRKIKYIDSDTFQGLVSLETIDFNSNQIEEIHEKTFAGLKNLKQINFENNEIKEIHENTLNGLESLKILNFNCNQLKTCSASLFIGLDYLKEIDFSYNKITEIDKNMFKNNKILVIKF